MYSKHKGNKGPSHIFSFQLFFSFLNALISQDEYQAPEDQDSVSGSHQIVQKQEPSVGERSTCKYPNYRHFFLNLWG